MGGEKEKVVNKLLNNLECCVCLIWGDTTSPGYNSPGIEARSFWAQNTMLLLGPLGSLQRSTVRETKDEKLWYCHHHYHPPFLFPTLHWATSWVQCLLKGRNHSTCLKKAHSLIKDLVLSKIGSLSGLFSLPVGKKRCSIFRSGCQRWWTWKQKACR